MADEIKKEKDRAKVRCWERYKKGGIRARVPYMKMRKETLSYFKSNREEFFLKQKLVDFTKGGVCLSINKPAELRSILGANLYQTNPTRVCNAKTKDSVQQGRAKVTAAYGNYTDRETEFEKHGRKAVDESNLSGRGFGRVGFDTARGCIASSHLSSARVVIDPSAESFEDAMWIGIRTRSPVWAVKRLFANDGEKWRTKGLKANYCSLRQVSEDDETGEETVLSGSNEEVSNDLVEYWEFYSKMGAGLARDPEASSEYKNESDHNDYVKIVIAEGHPVPLYEGPWPEALYLDKEWPIVPLDMIDCVDNEIWPQSPFGQNLPYAKIIDFTTTLRLHEIASAAMRRLLYDADALEGQEPNRLVGGKPFEAIAVKRGNWQKIADAYHFLVPPPMGPEAADERQWAEIGFERGTGVTSLLAGGTESGAQDRSAAASQNRASATNTRIEDMASKIEGWKRRLCRNEGILLWIDGFVDPVSVEKACGDLELGFMVSVKGNGSDETGASKMIEVPLRAPPVAAPVEGMEPSPAPLSLMEMDKAVAEYFVDEQLAMQAAGHVQELLLELYDAGDSRVMQYASTSDDPMAEPGMPVFDVSVRPVKVTDVFRDSQGMTPKEIAAEFSFSIEAGSGQRLDANKKLEIANNMVLNMVPGAQADGDYDFINGTLKMVYDASGVPSNERQFRKPPPLPMPGMPGMGPPIAEPQGEQGPPEEGVA